MFVNPTRFVLEINDFRLKGGPGSGFEAGKGMVNGLNAN